MKVSVKKRSFDLKGTLPHSVDLFEVLKGTSINFIGYVIWQLLGLGYVYLLARFLSSNDLGLYYLGVTIINLIGLVSLAGTDTGVRRFVAIYHGAKEVGRMWNTLASAFLVVSLLSICIGGVLFLCSGVIAESMSKPALGIVLKVLSPSLPFFAITAICLAATQAMKYMQYKVYSQDIANAIFKILIFVALYVLGYRLLGAALAYVCSITLVTGMSIYFFAKVLPQRRLTRDFGYDFKELLSFSLPQTFSGILYHLTRIMDILMLGYLTLASSVGIYAVIFRVVGSGACILTSFNTMFGPMIADLHHQKKYAKLENLYKTITKWILTLSLPIYLFLIFFADHILMIFGSEFSEASTCLIILSFGQIINAATGPSGLMVLMSGHSYINLFNDILSFTSNLVLNLLLIPKYGIVGAAIATSFSMMLINVIRVIEVYFLLKLQPYGQTFLKAIFAGFASIAIVLLASKNITTTAPLSLGAIGIVFFLLYSAGLMLLKLDEADRLVLAEFKRFF